MKIEVVSKERISPSSPTPPHLKTYKLCSLDQLTPPIYVPMLFFYLDDHTKHVDISSKSQKLRNSLKETLTRFYPLAGKIIDGGLSVDCNDDGIYFIETRVDCDLSAFLKDPDLELAHQLLPKIPTYAESGEGVDVVLVQVNFFECGGVGLGISGSHQILDGTSAAGFFNDWASTNRGISIENPPPSFVASSLFPQSEMLKVGSTFCIWPSMFANRKFVTGRFVFDSKSLNELKEKIASSEISQKPTRVLSVLALIWKCAIAAASKTKYDSEVFPSVFTLATDIRRRSNPTLPKSTVGNLIWGGVGKSNPESATDLASLVGYLRNGIMKIDNDFCQGLQGDEGIYNLLKSLKDLMDLYSDKGTHYLTSTSLCSSGMYETDFGWGKPVWIYLGLECQPLNVYLMDTRSGDGIEAWVSLLEEDMIEFKNDPEIAAFTSLNPSPLKTTHPKFQVNWG